MGNKMPEVTWMILKAEEHCKISALNESTKYTSISDYLNWIGIQRVKKNKSILNLQYVKKTPAFLSVGGTCSCVLAHVHVHTHKPGNLLRFQEHLPRKI